MILITAFNITYYSSLRLLWILTLFVDKSHEHTRNRYYQATIFEAQQESNLKPPKCYYVSLPTTTQGIPEPLPPPNIKGTLPCKWSTLSSARANSSQYIIVLYLSCVFYIELLHLLAVMSVFRKVCRIVASLVSIQLNLCALCNDL